MKQINLKLAPAIWLNRWALFIVYFWFGLLKFFRISPAEALVTKLFNITLSSWIAIDQFIPIFGLFECIVGLLWLLPGKTKVAFFLMLAHMFCTFLPMFLLVKDTWQESFVLTMSGQYIMKNVVLIAAGTFIFQLYQLRID